jgi:hypothetical protein
MTRTYDITLADLQEQHAAVVRGHVATEQIPDFLGGAFGEAAGAAAAQGLTLTGPPFARYSVPDEGRFDIEAGFPVSGAVTAVGRVEPRTLPGGTAARTMHVGAYDAVGAAYEAVQTYLTDNGYEPSGAPWECYLDDPEVESPRTEVVLPCRPARPHED